MGVMVQILDVPDDLHARLAARAERAGLTLSDYLLGELKRVSELGSMEEWLEKLRTDSPVVLSEEPADIIRRMRDSA